MLTAKVGKMCAHGVSLQQDCGACPLHARTEPPASSCDDSERAKIQAALEGDWRKLGGDFRKALGREPYGGHDFATGINRISERVRTLEHEAQRRAREQAGLSLPDSPEFRRRERARRRAWLIPVGVGLVVLVAWTTLVVLTAVGL